MTRSKRSLEEHRIIAKLTSNYPIATPVYGCQINEINIDCGKLRNRKHIFTVESVADLIGLNPEVLVRKHLPTNVIFEKEPVARKGRKGPAEFTDPVPCYHRIQLQQILMECKFKVTSMVLNQ